jgi:hypothetical protein
MMRFFLFFFCCIAMAPPAMASIVKKPPVKSTETAYKDLVCTDEHRACIHELITTMAEHGKLALLFKQNHLKGIGDRISDVHPMKFLEVIFSDPQLKGCMTTIWGDYFKRNGFMEGLGPSLSREMEKGKLMQYLSDFGTAIHVPAEQMKIYFEYMDWDNLVLFLIQS